MIVALHAGIVGMPEFIDILEVQLVPKRNADTDLYSSKYIRRYELTCPELRIATGQGMAPCPILAEDLGSSAQ